MIAWLPNGLRHNCASSIDALVRLKQSSSSSICDAGGDRTDCYKGNIGLEQDYYQKCDRRDYDRGQAGESFWNQFERYDEDNADDSGADARKEFLNKMIVTDLLDVSGATQHEQR